MKKKNYTGYSAMALTEKMRFPFTKRFILVGFLLFALGTLNGYAQTFDYVVADFEENEIGDTYPAANNTTTVSVVANPTVENEKSLSSVATPTSLSWRETIKVAAVTLPDGYTLADCQSISFDVYVAGNNNYKQIYVQIGDNSLFANGRYQQVSPVDAWGTVSVNLHTGVSTYDDGIEYPQDTGQGTGGIPLYTNGSLTSFDLFIGLNEDGATYLIDNVKFVINGSVVVTNPVTDVSLKSTTTLVVGATEQLTPTIVPNDATNKNVTWNSSNPSVATVSATGLVTAVTAGEATITVTTADGNFTATCAVNVTAASTTYTINTSAGANGSISPSGAVSVNSGGGQIFTITPNSGYKINQVLIDGTNNPEAVSTGSYAFSNVTADHTIEVSFIEDTQITTYTITATAGIGGGISPGGTITVNSGDNKTFTFTVNTGYKIKEVLVDDVNNLVAVTERSYTFENVMSNHTIEVSFIKDSTQEPEEPCEVCEICEGESKQDYGDGKVNWGTAENESDYKLNPDGFEVMTSIDGYIDDSRQMTTANQSDLNNKVIAASSTGKVYINYTGIEPVTISMSGSGLIYMTTESDSVTILYNMFIGSRLMLDGGGHYTISDESIPTGELTMNGSLSISERTRVSTTAGVSISDGINIYNKGIFTVKGDLMFNGGQFYNLGEMYVANDFKPTNNMKSLFVNKDGRVRIGRDMDATEGMICLANGCFDVDRDLYLSNNPTFPGIVGYNAGVHFEGNLIFNESRKTPIVKSGQGINITSGSNSKGEFASQPFPDPVDFDYIRDGNADNKQDFGWNFKWSEILGLAGDNQYLSEGSGCGGEYEAIIFSAPDQVACEDEDLTAVVNVYPQSENEEDAPFTYFWYKEASDGVWENEPFEENWAGQVIITKNEKIEEKFKVDVWDNTHEFWYREGVEFSLYLIPDTLVWTGAANNQDWNDAANWFYPGSKGYFLTDAAKARWIPRLCTDVTIPALLGNYPNLENPVTNHLIYDDAACDSIWFHHGGEVQRTDLLHYTRALVEMQLNSNQWYMLSSPLKNTYSGDFYIDNNNPFEDLTGRGMLVQMMFFDIENSQTGEPKIPHDWNYAFNTNDEIVQSGQGFALMAMPRNSAVGETNCLDSKPFWFPKMDPKHGYWNLEGVPTEKPSKDLDRSYSGRFIYEEDNGKAPESGNVPLNHSSLVEGKMVLVGNPFMAQLDFEKFYEDNIGLIYNEYKIAYGINTGHDDAMNSFKTYKGINEDFSVTNQDPEDLTDKRLTRYIPPMQSFIVYAKVDSEEKLKANIAEHTVTVPVVPNNILRSSQEATDKELLYVTASRGTQKDYAVLVHLSEGNKDFRPEEDSRKLFDEKAKASVLVYLLSKDGVALDINTTNDLEEMIPIGIRTSKTGDITLKFSGMDAFGNRQIYLHDLKDHRVVNLSEQSEYTFTKDEPDLFIDDRFYIAFGSPTGIDKSSILDGIAVLNPDINTIQILANNGQSLDAIEIINVQGIRLVKENNFNRSTYSYRVSVPGIYIVKAMGETKKIIVK